MKATASVSPFVDLPAFPAIVSGVVSHVRRRPFVHRFRYRTYQWLVDVNDLPHWPPLVTFAAEDHLDQTADSLRSKVATFTAAHGVPLRPSDRVLMLANARCFGHVFDPLSVFWCLTTKGVVRCVILEIHNTYGDRHAHLIHPDQEGRCSLEKEFYVSPFLTVEGCYDVTLRLSRNKVTVSVGLTQRCARIFAGSFTGTPHHASRTTIVMAAIRVPFVTYQVTTLIRLHGLWLWLRTRRTHFHSLHVPREGVR